MRSIKIVGLASMLALVIAVALGAGSASATTVCKAVQNPCAAGNKYASGTDFGAGLKAGTEAVIDLGGFEVRCPVGTMDLKTSALEGAPLSGEIKEFAFGKACTGCTTVTVIRLNYKTELERTTAGNGSLTARSGGAGNPAIKLTGCPLGASCIFTAEAVGAVVTGGQTAEIKFADAPFTKENGSPTCGAEAKFSAVYSITLATEPGMMGVANPRVMVEG